MHRLAPFLLIACSAPSAFGWGCEGHQMIALIARAHLTPAASRAVDELLSRNPIDPALNRYCAEGPADLMANASTWADDIRQHEKTGAWHYIDIPLAVEDGDLGKWCPPIGPPVGGADRPGCVANALESERAVLRDKSRPSAERADALRYLIHFTGDLHQPLHTEDNDDRGGNCTSMKFFDESRPANLHSIWDTKIIEHDFEAHPATDQAAYAHDLDVKFADKWPEWGEAKPDIAAWVWEGHALARQIAYGDLSPSIPLEAPKAETDCNAERAKVARLRILVGQRYFEEALAVVNERLARAGYRLAAILNETFQ